MNQFRMICAALIAVVMLVVANPIAPADAQTVRPPENAQVNNPDVQTEAQGTTDDSMMWQAIRKGLQGDVSIPDKKAGTLVQSEGETYMQFRNGPLTTYSAYALFAMLFLLSLYFVLRGRIKIDHGKSGVTIERFNGVERFGHWLMAGSFVVLALSGLNMLFGRYVLMPVIGKEFFSIITLWGKYLHNYLAFAFMAGVVIVFIMWVKHNIPTWIDVKWLLKGGGMFTKGVHPEARKFNAGQKILFWLVTLLTISVSLSGIALMFPFETAFMAKTFGLINVFGFNLPTDIAPLQEQQLNQIWHAIVGVAFTVIIIAHIYIGSVGMEGAFDAMGSGEVDTNWAREHHNLWVEEMEQKGTVPSSAQASRQPAE